MVHLTETLDIVSCDPCDSAELLPQSTVAMANADLQALALDSLPPLPDPSCGYRPVEASYQDALIPEQSLDLGQAFMASQMPDIGVTIANEMQEAPGSDVANSIIESHNAIPPSNSEALTPHTPTENTYPPSCQLGLQDQMPAHPLLMQPHHPLQDPPITSGNNSPTDQSSAVFSYPSLLSGNPNPDPVTAQPLPNQNQPPAALNPAAPGLPCSLPSQGAPTAFFPPVQNLSFPNVSPTPTHPALHLPNLSPAQALPLAAAFPPSSFAHPSSSLPHHPFQPSSCLGVSAAPSLPPAAHSQNLSPVSAPSSYPAVPPVEIGAIPQFNPPAPYLPEMVLHHPSLLPQLDPSLPSCNAPPTLYPAFPSYPLRLCQDPCSSLSIPLRHLYRQHQHGHAHPQGSYLDVSTRAAF
ncbi:hypothetical protein LDENG_00295920 [Lucifuga dentata]|nr:hypothetical protein LDENG_00295920 [Lucifuga dentata]